MKDYEFVDRFIEVFAGNNESYRKKIKTVKKGRGYLWLLFNEKLVLCFEGDRARAEFDRVDKTEAFEIQYYNGFLGDEETSPLKKEHLTSTGIDDSCLPEFYVIGKEFSWCYVVTHEFDLCGPYFCYAPKKIDSWH